MASPGIGAGKRAHPIPYASDVNQSRMSLHISYVTRSLFLSVVSCQYCSKVLNYILCAANIRVVDPVREFGSPGIGNVAWKERVDGWKMKQEKNVIPMSTGQATSERGGGDIDARSDVIVDDSLLWVLFLLNFLFLCSYNYPAFVSGLVNSFFFFWPRHINLKFVLVWECKVYCTRTI